MNSEALKSEKGDHPHPIHKVWVTVDGQKKHVLAGPRVVSAFKEEVGVPAEKALDQVINGQLVPLDDGSTIDIHGDEVFISHGRQGGSS